MAGNRGRPRKRPPAAGRFAGAARIAEGAYRRGILARRAGYFPHVPLKEHQFLDLSEARSRLYRRRFLQVDAHLAESFKLYMYKNIGKSFLIQFNTTVF